MPVVMDDLFVFLAFINEMVEKLKTFLECGQMFLAEFFPFLFLQQVKIRLQQLENYNMHT